MERSELDKKILTIYQKLDRELSKEEKSVIHFKSVSNFIYHLVENPQINPKQNKKLQELGEVRIKKELLEYLNLDFDFNLSNKNSIYIYYKRLKDVCIFMVRYYDFSISGGMSKIISYIPFFFFGLILDILMYVIFSFIIPTFTISFLLIYIIRTYIKHKQRRVYGPNY